MTIVKLKEKFAWYFEASCQIAAFKALSESDKFELCEALEHNAPDLVINELSEDAETMLSIIRYGSLKEYLYESET